MIDLKKLFYSRVNDRKIKSILQEAGEKIRDDIKSLAPVDTGTYRDSIQLSEVKKDGNIYSIDIFSELKVGGDNEKWKDIPLGYLLEWGTGINGESTNTYNHGFPYRQTPWTYYNERYGRWITTNGNKAVPHFYPGLHLNEQYFKDLVKKEIVKK